MTNDLERSRRVAHDFQRQLDEGPSRPNVDLEFIERIAVEMQVEAIRDLLSIHERAGTDDQWEREDPEQLAKMKRWREFLERYDRECAERH